MEEDIKTIQEKMNTIESLCTDDCINKSVVVEPLKYAIKNLIARNKELESALDNSVSKDEIKAKIEEIDNEIWYCDSVKKQVKRVLQELLNKGE